MSNQDVADAVFAFDAAGIGICILRRRLICRCNSEFSDIFGFRQEELRGRNLAYLYPSRSEYETADALRAEIMRRSGRYREEHILQRKDGTLFWCRIVCRSLFNGDPHAATV